ncbi:MAG TPA: MarR family winged helix-turn-helix transcriptional regulator [Candidatus Nanopelagicaceae bacterium]|nr:MarR family winged helix-turn-helix transcriptional regulator [Candidatus Nanopelagicaceae bacterium]
MHANKSDQSAALFLSLGGFLRAIHANARADEYADKGAIKLLAYLDACGIQRLSDLPKEIPLDLSTISRHCASLTRDGLLDRTDDPNDRRAALINITDAGREHLEQVRTEKTALLKDATTHWSQEDIRDFIRLLDRMAEDLENFSKTERDNHRPESIS